MGRWGVDWAKASRRHPRSRWERRPARPREPEAAEPPISSPGLGDPAWNFHVDGDACCAAVKGVKMTRAEAARFVYLERGRALNSCDYSLLLQREKEEAPELWPAVSALFDIQKSTYRARLKDPRLIERYDAKADGQIRDLVAVLRRRRNKDDIAFSVQCRSLSYFNQRVPTRLWKENRRALRIVGREPCMKLLDAMIETDPGPPWWENEHVAVFCADQCNIWQASETSKKVSALSHAGIVCCSPHHVATGTGALSRY